MLILHSQPLDVSLACRERNVAHDLKVLDARLCEGRHSLV